MAGTDEDLPPAWARTCVIVLSAVLILAALPVSVAPADAQDGPTDLPEAELIIQPSQLGYGPGEAVATSIAIANDDEPITFWGGLTYKTYAVPVNESALELNLSDNISSLPSVELIDGPNGTTFQLVTADAANASSPPVSVDAEPIRGFRTTLDFAPDGWRVQEAATCQIQSMDDPFWQWDYQGTSNHTAEPGTYLLVTLLHHPGSDQMIRGAAPVILGEQIPVDSSPTVNPTPSGCEPIDASSDPGILATNGALGYDFITDPERWPKGAFPVEWNYNDNNRDSGVSYTGAKDAIERAFNTWTFDAASSVAFTEGPDSQAGAWKLNDGLNTVTWGRITDDDNDPVLAAADCHSEPGATAAIEVITECGMKFNSADFDWSTTDPPGSGDHDLESVAAHEVGHWLKLDHPCDDEVRSNCPGDDDEQVMYCCFSKEEVRRSLKWGDKSGVRYIYPERHTAVHQGMGSDTKGSGVLTAQFGSPFGLSGRDALFAWADISNDPKEVRYRIGWDLDSDTGKPHAMSSIKTAVTNLQSDPDGVAVAYKNFDGDGRRDVVFAWIHNPFSSNTIRYVIGWNIDTNGNPQSWSAVKTAVSGSDVGAFSDGLGACVTNLDGDARADDLVFAWVDDAVGENEIRYVVGSDLDANGDASWHPYHTAAPGEWVGSQSRGLGLACTNIDEFGVQDLIIAWVDDHDGPNRFWYRIGFNPSFSGQVNSWTDQKMAPGTVEQPINDGTEGAGLGGSNIDGEAIADLLFTFVNTPSGDNKVRYMEEWNGRWTQHP